MKKLLFALLLLPGVLLAQNGGFTIKGNIEGLKEGEEVRILSSQDKNLVARGVAVKEGSFTVQGSIPEPSLYLFQVGSEEPQHIFLENREIKVSGKQKDLKNLKIQGSSSHQDFDQFRKVFNPLVTSLNALAAQIQKTENEKRRADLMVQYDSLTKKVSHEVGAFIQARPASYVSPFLMFVTAQLYDDPMLMEQRYNSLDPAIRQSGIGRSLAEFIAYNKVGAVGTEAIDFTQNDPEGNAVTLSSFKGKYVLVDFWASWCKPCRIENPNVVKAYNKFKDKNFTIVGVSLDQTREAWLKAIEKDGLRWTHVSDLQNWNNAVAQQYHISSIPQNFLIDPTGKIVAKNLTGAALESKLCELLGCN